MLHLRFDMNLDMAMALCRMFDRERSGAISFADLVHGYYVVGAATVDEKCDAAVRLYDVHGDGFLTREHLLQISDDVGHVLSMDLLSDEVLALSAELESHAGAAPLDLEAIHARVAARVSAAPTKSAAAARAAAAAKPPRSDVTTPADDSTGSALTAKKGAKASGGSGGGGGGGGAQSTESLRIRSARARLAIALPLFEKALEFGAGEHASMRDVQRTLISDLLAQHGVEQFVPLIQPQWDESDVSQPIGGATTSSLSSSSLSSLAVAPPSDERGRASKEPATLAVPGGGLRHRSRSPLGKKEKRGSDDSSVPTLLVTPADSSVGAATAAAAAHVPAEPHAHKATLQLGVPAAVFREAAKANPALLFALLHVRKFTQGTLLALRPNRERRSEYDAYAYGRPPIVIDLSNLAKTEREIVRRRQSDEQAMRDKTKREQKDLESMRKSGSNIGAPGGGGGGGSGGGGNELKKSQGGGGGSGGGSGGGGGMSVGGLSNAMNAQGAMGGLTMGGGSAALFQR